MDIGLISCGKSKLNYKAKAKELYIGDLFKKSLEYSIKNYDKTFILSAKYGLVGLNDIIEPYNLTFKNFKEAEKKRWSFKVYNQIINNINSDDNIYWHCGINYRKYIARVLPNKQFIPLEGLGLLKQLSWYKNNL